MSSALYSIEALPVAIKTNADAKKIALIERKRRLFLGPPPTIADYQKVTDAQRSNDDPRCFGYGWPEKIYESNLFINSPRGANCDTCELANVCRNQSINLHFAGWLIEHAEGYPRSGTPTEQSDFARKFANQGWQTARMRRLLKRAEIVLENRAENYEKHRPERRAEWRRERTQRYRKEHPGAAERAEKRATKRAAIDASLADREFSSTNKATERQRRWREGKKLAAAKT